ncbi:type II secretion system protein GspM [Aliidiomarina sp. Khilg15.8]
MKAYQQTQAWFAARARREQILIAVAALIVVWLGASIFWLGPAQEQLDAKQTRLQQQRTELATLQQEVSRFEQQLAVDPNTELEQRENELQARQDRLEARMNRNARLMTPEQSVAWLQSMLDADSAVQVLHFDTLEPSPILAVGESQSTGNGMNLYQHSVEVTVEGEYLALRAYVERLQSLPFEYYWQGLRYEVQDYPTAQLTVTLYALSTSKELIGG